MPFAKHASDLEASLIATQHDLLDELSDRIDEAQTMGAVAEELGVSLSYLSSMLHGSRGVGADVAKRMGWKRVVLFVKE